MKTDRLLITVSLLILFVFSVSCNKNEDQPDYYVNTPIAGFSYTGNDGPAPVTIQFYNTSQYADQFEWSIDNAPFSTERDPAHVFHNAGSEVKTFLVTLKATDSSSGQYQRKSKSIAVQPGS